MSILPPIEWEREESGFLSIWLDPKCSNGLFDTLPPQPLCFPTIVVHTCSISRISHSRFPIMFRRNWSTKSAWLRLTQAGFRLSGWLRLTETKKSYNRRARLCWYANCYSRANVISPQEVVSVRDLLSRKEFWSWATGMHVKHVHHNIWIPPLRNLPFYPFQNPMPSLPNHVPAH